MWRVDVKTLSTAERALWDAFPGGEIVDLSGRARVGSRTVRAEVIAALLVGALPADAGRIAAVRLDGARITGTLNLGHGLVTAPVRLRRCEVTDVIDLTGAKARDVDLSGSNSPASPRRSPSSTAISTSAGANARGRCCSAARTSSAPSTCTMPA